MDHLSLRARPPTELLLLLLSLYFTPRQPATSSQPAASKVVIPGESNCKRRAGFSYCCLLSCAHLAMKYRLAGAHFGPPGASYLGLPGRFRRQADAVSRFPLAMRKASGPQSGSGAAERVAGRGSCQSPASSWSGRHLLIIWPDETGSPARTLGFQLSNAASSISMPMQIPPPEAKTKITEADWMGEWKCELASFAGVCKFWRGERAFVHFCMQH